MYKFKCAENVKICLQWSDIWRFLTNGKDFRFFRLDAPEPESTKCRPAYEVQMCWKCQNMSAIAWYLTFFNQRWRFHCFFRLDAHELGCRPAYEVQMCSPKLSSRTIEDLLMKIKWAGCPPEPRAGLFTTSNTTVTKYIHYQILIADSATLNLKL